LSVGVVGLLLGLLILVTPAHATVTSVHDTTPATDVSFGNFIDSANGLLIVGQPLHNGESGEAFVFDARTGSLIRTLANPSTQFGGAFGWAVEVSGKLLVVTAPSEDVSGIHSAGRVYIFNTETGTLLESFVSSSPQDFGDFGRSVDLADGLLAVGAPFETVDGMLAGRVHVFDVETGSEIMTLVSPNPEANGIFGAKVDVSNGRIIVGALGESHLVGRAYVFSAATGALISTLVSPNGPNTVFFGSSVAVTHQLAFVGSIGETVNGLEAAGSVYVFDVTTGSLVGTFVDPNPETGGRFGFSLKLSDNSLIVGAPSDTVGAFTTGRVYVFNAATGSLTTTLISPDTGVYGSPGLFGNAVDSDNGRIYVGAPAQMVDGQLWAGSAYIFA
jgi:hypothetical protein